MNSRRFNCRRISVPVSQGRIVGYPIGEDQSGGNSEPDQGPARAVPGADQTLAPLHCWLTNGKNDPTAAARFRPRRSRPRALGRQRLAIAAARGQVVLRGHLPERADPAGEGLLVGDRVEPRTLLLPECAELLCARPQEQDAEVQRRRQPDHLSREPIARQREGIELATGARWELFYLDPGLLARPGHPRRHLEATGHQGREVTLGRRFRPT